MRPRESTRLCGWRRVNLPQRGFTLVELLTVVAIMAIVMGVLAVSLNQGQSRGVQAAAAQTASGLGLARQLAITRNTTSMFIVAPRAGQDRPGEFYPLEAFRYWAVVYSNRGSNTWTLANDWTQLPAGASYVTLSGPGYNTITWSPDGKLPAPGSTFAPKIQASSKGEWQYFNSFTNLRITWAGKTETVNTVPFIGFAPSGKGVIGGASGTNIPSAAGLAIGEAVTTPDGKLLLRSTNNITIVETDSKSGRIVVRPRESYR